VIDTPAPRAEDFFPFQRAGSDFPLDVDAPTLFHSRGHLGRASAFWLAKHLESMSSRGADGPELAVFCSLLAARPFAQAHGLLRWAAQLKPDTLDTCSDPDLARPALERLAQTFEQAAALWTPPLEPALRGWSKQFEDDQVQQESRELFDALAQRCRQWALIGLPEGLRLLALTQEPTFKARAAPKAALSILADVAAARPDGCAGFLGPHGDSLRAAAATLLSPSKFRSAMEKSAHALGLDAEQGAASLGRALRQAPAEARMASLEYCAQWCANQRPHGAALSRALFEAVLDQPLADGAACQNAFVALAQGAQHRSSSVIRCGLGLAQEIKSASGAWVACESMARMMWQAHLDIFRSTVSAKRAPVFCAQHAQLSKLFPHAQFAAASLAKATPAVAAQVEKRELADALAFGPQTPWGAVDGGEAEEPARPKMRL
jgi:hypothetical protein